MNGRLVELFVVPLWETFRIGDVEGRPLGEAAFEGALDAVPTEWRVCPYPGGRQNHARPMNWSALRQMTARWDELLLFTKDVRRAFGVWENSDAPLTVSQLGRFATVASLVPYFMVERRNDPVGRDAMPVLVAASFKAMQGVAQAVEHMNFLRLTQGLTADVPADAAALIAHVEDAGLFEGRAGVCAGSPQLIERLVATMIAPVGEAIAGAPFARQVGDVEQFRAFAEAMVALHLAKRLYSARSLGVACAVEEAIQQDGGSPASWEGLMPDVEPLRWLQASRDGRVAMDHTCAQIATALAELLARMKPEAWPSLALPSPTEVPVEPEAALAVSRRIQDGLEERFGALFGLLQRRIDRALLRDAVAPVAFEPADLERALGLFARAQIRALAQHISRDSKATGDRPPPARIIE